MLGLYDVSIFVHRQCSQLVLLGSKLEAGAQKHVTLILQFLSDMVYKIIYQARSTLNLTSIFSVTLCDRVASGEES